MNGLRVSVSVTAPDEESKTLEEEHEPALPSLIEALKKIKKSTNDYLTELVDKEKGNSRGRGDASCRRNAKDDYDDDEMGDESDGDAKEDEIDLEIRKELSPSQESSSSSESVNENRKRTRTKFRDYKKMRS